MTKENKDKMDSDELEIHLLEKKQKIMKPYFDRLNEEKQEK
jgi:hypothetical protein